MRLRRSKLSAAQSRLLCEQFVAGTSARAVAGLAGVNKNTAVLFYRRLREIIAEAVENDSRLHAGGGWSASYFGGGDKRSALEIAGHPVGIQFLGHGAQAYARITLGDDASNPIVPALDDPNGASPASGHRNGGIQARSAIGGNGSGGGVTELGNGMAMYGRGEAWFYQVRRLLKTYNGVPPRNVRLFLKECEWRLNYGSQAELLDTLEAWLGQSGRAASSED